MNSIRVSKYHAKKTKNFHLSHHKEGSIIILGLVAIALGPFLIFGSYGIYKSVHNQIYKHDTKHCIQKTKRIAISIKREFSQALRILKTYNGHFDKISETTLKEIDQALSSKNKNTTPENEINLAQQAIQEASRSLHSLNIKKQSDKKYHIAIQKLSDELSNLNSEFDLLKKILAQYRHYFDACILEHHLCQLLNKKLTDDMQTKSNLDKELKHCADNLKKIEKYLSPYPNLETQIISLSTQLQKQLHS